MRKPLVAAATFALVVGLAACTDEPKSSEQREREARSAGYDGLVNRQPAEQMEYSPTRETINAWIRTWDNPDAVSYVYLQNGDGDLIGYFVLKGLPVSYCTGLTPPYEWVDIPGDGGSTKTTVPAPADDGVYYSGGQCDTFYGVTADTGTYVEWQAGMGITQLLYNQPLPQHNNVPNLAPDA